MGFKLDVKLVEFSVAIAVIITIATSIYFTITTPAGQSGLAGLGLSIMNAIASPFIAIGNGISSFFSNLFGGIGNFLTSHL
jgi:hypothetical protein